MPQIRLALAQLNLTVGDIDGNADKIVRWTRHAAERGAHVVAFPEMALTGYPIEDLVLRPSFVERSRSTMTALAQRLADEGIGELVVVCGYLDRDDDAAETAGSPRGAPQNALAVAHRGQIIARSAKHHLPNYGVFDEFRYFVPGDVLPVLRVHGVDIALAICEDLWQDGGPIAATRAAGAGLLLVINGSPYEREKGDTRLDLVRRRAKQAMCPLAYVNLVGAQDELVFDGDSIVVDDSGEVMARAPQFSEGLLAVDLDVPKSPLGVDEYAGIRIQRTTVSDDPVAPYAPARAGIAPRMSDEEEIYRAIMTGVHDYVEKNSIERVFIMLSGGIDSALTATIAADALGADRVHTVAMPSRYSSDHSIADAEDLANRQGLHHRVIPINDMVETFEKPLSLSGKAAENVQARIRGVTIMALSNANEPSIVLATGNKSELSVGYSTIYGDAVGGYAPLKDVLKTTVSQLAKWRNKVATDRGETAPIPENTISKPPSAELSPGQLDTDSLPPYELLDDMLDDYVEQDAAAGELIGAGFEAETVERVIRMVDAAEYKRRQFPPGPKISFKAFGRDRRLPITNAWREPSGQTTSATTPGQHDPE